MYTLKLAKHFTISEGLNTFIDNQVTYLVLIFDGWQEKPILEKFLILIMQTTS